MFLSYEHGYANRGLIGSLFQLVHGPTTIEKIYQFFPLWDKCILVVVVLLFWAMFIPRIWTSDFWELYTKRRGNQRFFLTSFHFLLNSFLEEKRFS